MFLFDFGKDTGYIVADFVCGVNLNVIKKMFNKILSFNEKQRSKAKPFGCIYLKMVRIKVMI